MSDSMYFLLKNVCRCQSEIAIYCAGFPCTPYSMLGNRLCLLDPNARQLYACVKRMKVTRPKVPGLKKFGTKCLSWYRPDEMENMFPNHWGSITGKRDGILISGNPSGRFYRKELPRASCLTLPFIFKRLCFASFDVKGGFHGYFRYEMLYVSTNPCLLLKYD